MFGSANNAKELNKRPKCPFRVSGNMASAKQGTLILGCMAEDCMMGEAVELDGDLVEYRCALAHGMGAYFSV